MYVCMYVYVYVYIGRAVKDGWMGGRKLLEGSKR